MNMLELGENMLDLRDSYANHSEWQETLDDLEPLIRLLMEDTETDNPLKAIMPVLRDAQENNDTEVAQMILAVAVDILLRDKIKN